jgi:hypothetical protein
MNSGGAKRGIGMLRARAVLVALLLLFFAAEVTASATDKARPSYPEKGKVVSATVSEHTDYVPVSPPDSKGRSSGGQAFVHRNWVYRVETDVNVYEFKGGKTQSMAVGDTVEFRVVKDTGYILADDKEIKYRILSNSPKPAK